jgi:hypothetical protein
MRSARQTAAASSAEEGVAAAAEGAAASSGEEGMSAAAEGAAASSAESDCAICLGAFELSDAATLDSCTHAFCRDCIVAWSAITSRCPLCKRAFGAISHAGVRLAVEAREQRVDGAAYGFPVLDEDEDDDDEDGWETPCEVCGLTGDEHLLLLCDGEGCTGACHVACAGLERVPDGDFFCARCNAATAADADGEGEATRSPRRDDASTAVTHTPPQAAAPAPAAAPTLFERFRFGQS